MKFTFILVATTVLLHLIDASPLVYVDPSLGADSLGCGATMAQPCWTVNGSLAQGPSEIILLAGSYSGAGNVNITFNYSVIISGFGAVYVLGGMNSWVIQSNVTVQGVAFAGADTAVLVYNSTVSFSNCSFANNTNGMLRNEIVNLRYVSQVLLARFISMDPQDPSSFPIVLSLRTLPKVLIYYAV